MIMEPVDGVHGRKMHQSRIGRLPIAAGSAD